MNDQLTPYLQERADILSIEPRPIAVGESVMHHKQRVTVIAIHENEAWVEWHTEPSPTLGISTRKTDVVPLFHLTREDASDE